MTGTRDRKGKCRCKCWSAKQIEFHPTYQTGVLLLAAYHIVGLMWTYTSFTTVLVCITLPTIVLGWQGKSTIAASDPLRGLAFALKYLPVNVAEDNGDGDIDTIGDSQLWVQGRSSVLLNGSYTERNCQLFSSLGAVTSAEKYQSMTSRGLGKNCHYSNNTKYSSGSELHSVFAYNKRQCCNACVATKGCVAAHFETSDMDKSGMGHSPLDHNWEGFAIHMASVTSNTTGGLPVGQVEALFKERLGGLEKFDAFLDYSVTFYTHSLQPYYDAFSRDKVPVLVAQWEEEASHRPWYSLFVLIPGTMYVVELTSPLKPVTAAPSTLPRIEQRLALGTAAKFCTYPPHPAHILWVASVNRASSDMSAIHQQYRELLQARVTHQVHTKEVQRRCYMMSEQNATEENTFLWNQVCFTRRAVGSPKDKVFSVADFERMLWAEHAGTVGSNPNSQVDRYTDNHDGLLLNHQGIAALQQHFVEHNPYPITNSTRLAYMCKQVPI